MNILLTGTRHFVSLRTARQLKKTGHTVYSADSIDFDYTGFSLAVKKRFEMPSVRFAERKYIEKLIGIIKEYKIDKLVPLSEEIFYIARNANKIKAVRPRIIIEADDIEKLDILHNKESFFRLSKSLNLQIPNTRIVSTIDEVIRYQKNNNSNIVLKPVYSRFADRFMHFETINETKKYFAKTVFAGKFILQDFIAGENISTFSLNDKSEVITYHSDIEMSRPGAMSSIAKIETPDVINNADKAIRKSLGFKYQLGLDFIKTSAGELYLLEANPRATMGRLLYEKDHAQFRILAFHQFISGLIPKGSRLRFFRNLFFYPDAVSKWSDPAPVLVSQIGCVGLASYLRFCKEHPGSSFQAYSTFDMEYNGDEFCYDTVKVGKEDGSKILELLEELSAKQSYSITQTRRPDPLKSFSTDGKRVTVAAVKSQNEIAYLGACAENDFFISGKNQPVGYISAIRKNPDFLYQIDWRDALYGYFRKQHKNVDTFMLSVMADNTHAIKSLTKATGSVPAAEFVCKYKTFIVNTLRFKTRELPGGVTLSQLTGKDEVGALRFLKDEGKKYELFPEVKSLRSNFLGATSKNSYVLRRDGEIVGFAAVLDQTDKKQYFVKRYARWIRAIKKPFNRISGPMKLITMPDEESTITCPTVSLCLVKDNDPELYDLFVRRLSAEIKKKSNIFTISIALNNLCIKTLESYWNLSIEYNLYVVNYVKKKIALGNVYVDGAIF